MANIEKVIMAIFGGVITLAIISVIISKKSQSPQVLQAASSALANVVAAAVTPVGTSNNGANAFTTPSH